MALKVLKLRMQDQTYSMKERSFYTGETNRRILIRRVLDFES